MRVLERPVAAGPPRSNAAPAGLVYLGPGLLPAAFAALFDELRLQAMPLQPAALVDVKAPRVFLLSGASLADGRLAQTVADLQGDLAAVVLLGPAPELPGFPLPLAVLDLQPSPASLRAALRTALGQLALHERLRKDQLELDRRSAQIADLHHVGVALSAVRDIDALQTLVLTKARAITSADAGSLYLIVPATDEEPLAAGATGRPPSSPAQRVLAFNKAQNFSNPSPFHAFKMPLDAGIAGYVATTGAVVQHDDIYDLPPDVPYAFNAEFDRRTGYRSKSMLAVPMLNSDDQIIGVIQLINRKYRPDVKLTPASVDREVIPFSLEDRDLTLSFASQAAVALDNKRLIDSIQTLFEGFVTASVQAIESRDPTTSGHSGRVATLTVGLAEAVNHVRAGELARVHFGEQALREIRYAAVLHDFGKVGVREQVLVKAKKLYDWQVEQIRGRFGVARAALESRFLRRQLDYLRANGSAGAQAALAVIEGEYERELERLQAAFERVSQANEPTVLASDASAELAAVAGLTFAGLDGQPEPLVDPLDLRKLSIRRGSLDEAERREIESHVTHTYKFLTKIPWTHDLRGVPEIAWAHHEKLDGSGYPNGLTAAEIPVQSKMMAIADIYDALTAWDRPYKRAVPVDKALEILEDEATGGHIDGGLLGVFIAKRVYSLTNPER